jgi:hypothetical protein
VSSSIEDFSKDIKKINKNFKPLDIELDVLKIESKLEGLINYITVSQLSKKNDNILEDTNKIYLLIKDDKDTNKNTILCKILENFINSKFTIIDNEYLIEFRCTGSYSNRDKIFGYISIITNLIINFSKDDYTIVNKIGKKDKFKSNEIIDMIVEKAIADYIVNSKYKSEYIDFIYRFKLVKPKNHVCRTKVRELLLKLAEYYKEEYWNDRLVKIGLSFYDNYTKEEFFKLLVDDKEYIRDYIKTIVNLKEV